MGQPQRHTSASIGQNNNIRPLIPANNQSNHEPSIFADIPLLDYLQADTRPTFVLGLHPTTDNDSSHDTCLVFSNRTLDAVDFLHQQVVRSLTQHDSKSPSDIECDRFRTWLQEVRTGTQPRPCVSTALYLDHRWTCFEVGNRWLIVSGTNVPPKALDREHEARKDQSASQQLQTLNSIEDGQHNGHLIHSHTTSRNVKLLSSLPPSKYRDFVLSFDYTESSYGPISTWSPELVQVCQMMLVDPDPVVMYWGKDLSIIWNEAYLEVAGDKHPRLYGASPMDTWAEIWEQYGPLFDQMRLDRKAIKQQDQQLLIYRKGYLEETYFNITIMPITSVDGSLLGYYLPVMETTKQVLSERRMQILLKISETASLATSLDDLWHAILSALDGHESDIYFAVLCSIISGEEDKFDLEGSVGLDSTRLRTHVLTENGTDTKGLLSAFKNARRSNQFVILQKRDNTLSSSLIDELKSCGMEEECRSITVFPLSTETEESTSAYIAIGINPRREYDDDYEIFMQLLVRQIESTVTFIRLLETEKALMREQAAYESELKFTRFAEQAQVGIYIFDPSGATRYCNDTWLELCGLSRDKLHDPMCWVETIHPDNRDDIIGYWNKLVNGEGPQSFEVQFKKPWKPTNLGNEGIELDRTFVLANTEAEFNEQGECTSVVGCLTDISHSKWAEKIQSQRLTEALELKRQQENFLDITSHEMRNPLNAILHCASELIEQIGNQISSVMSAEKRAIVLSECLDAASTIAYCGKHQKRIIDDVLTMSKLDSGLLSISPLTARPPDIIKQVLRVFETELRTTQIEAVSQISEIYLQHGVDAVLLDPYRVIQILINLFSNAIKFMKDEETRKLKIVLDVSLQEPVDQKGGIRYVPSGRHRKDPTQHTEWGTGEELFIKFSVQDTGPGMTTEEANSLFNRFIQGSPRTHAQYGGSGLGLFISRELAELHGGRIGLSSQIGLGSTFDFYIKGRRDLDAPAKTQEVDRSRPSSITTNDDRRATTAHQHEEVISAVITSAPAMKSTRSSPSVLQTVHRRPLRVLIVEDNLINQRILKKIMTQQGYEVSIANQGEEALAIIETSRWHRDHREAGLQLDIVLCDVEMPVMDGKATVRRIRQLQSQRVLHPNIPVVAVTGNARSEQIKVALECGFDDVVSKPYEVQDLLKSVKHFTEKEHDAG